jgi:hypothetical protein
MTAAAGVNGGAADEAPLFELANEFEKSPPKPLLEEVAEALLERLSQGLGADCCAG